MGFDLRPYNSSDYDFVYNVKKIVYKTYVEMNWDEWNEEEQRELFKSFIDGTKNEIKIIVIDGTMAGFFHGHDIDLNNYEIGNICLLPVFQGNGIGTRILKSLIETHKNQDIYLRFFKQNPVVSLYKRLGFEICEELPHHYKMVLKQK